MIRLFVFAAAWLAPVMPALGVAPDAPCYELGKRNGRCAASTMAGRKCDDEDEIARPQRCVGDSEFDRGIRDGVAEARRPRRGMQRRPGASGGSHRSGPRARLEPPAEPAR
jgi:hypothetical protein